MDLAVLETGNGGDLQLIGNDLAPQQGWGNMPYLGMFGGAVESVTKQRVTGDDDRSWWGNNLLMPQDSSIQFNSLTEKKLMNVVLNSAGRIDLENTIKEDLKFMQAFADVNVTVSIISDDKIKILIRIKEIVGFQTPDIFRQFIYIWDATKRMLGDFSLNDFNDDFF